MIKGDISAITLLLEDGNYHVGELEFDQTGGEGHGGVARVSERVKVPLHFHVLGVEPFKPIDPDNDPAVTIYSTPQRLREVCEDILGQLDRAEGLGEKAAA
jgi:hypothetical protein